MDWIAGKIAYMNPLHTQGNSNNQQCMQLIFTLFLYFSFWSLYYLFLLDFGIIIPFLKKTTGTTCGCQFNYLTISSTEIPLTL
jgi:hypothetical protein